MRLSPPKENASSYLAERSSKSAVIWGICMFTAGPVIPGSLLSSGEVGLQVGGLLPMSVMGRGSGVGFRAERSLMYID